MFTPKRSPMLSRHLKPILEKEKGELQISDETIINLSYNERRMFEYQALFIPRGISVSSYRNPLDSAVTFSWEHEVGE